MSEKMRKLPPGPRGLPPLDDLRTLQQSPLAVVLKATAEYGDLVRYPLGPLTVYLANHPDHVKHVLQDNNRNYSKDTFQYNLLKSVTGNGLLTSDGNLWLRQRRLAQPAFHRERINPMGAMMVANCQRMLARWQPCAAHGQPLDMAAEMMHLALDIVGQALFSIDMSEKAASLAKAVLVVLDHVVYRARTLGMVPGFLPTQRNRNFRTALATLDRSVYALIEERRIASGRHGNGSDDLLTMFMEAQDEENAAGDGAAGARMSSAQLRDEVMTLIVAGHETVASALGWTWYLLSQNPAAEQKLHHELASVLGGRTPTVADLPSLPYTRMVFEEALRLYPPAWIITRKALDDDEIAGYHIPAGSLVVLSPYAAHRYPAFWPEAERFEPERFSAENSAARPRFAYFPFGGGPRLCIGNTFALVEAQLVIATVAQVYRPAMVPGGPPVEVEPSVTLRPRHGLLMTLNSVEEGE